MTPSTPAMSRRDFFGAAGSTAVAFAASPADQPAADLPPLQRPDGPAEAVARNEAYWRRVASHFDVSRTVINLENGFWGVMARPVLEAYLSNIRRVNVEGVVYVRGEYVAALEAARARVAAALGADVSEIAFTRGATEAMQCLIAGYNRLKPGDTVLYADLDYPGMQYVMNWLATRRGVHVARFVIPEPATRQNVLDAYAAALEAHRDARLMLVTHVSHKTGLVFPVPAIVALAKARGVDVIVDAAHSWGQVEMTVGSVGADFIGFSLQKWIAAPVGLGALFIRNGRTSDIDSMMGDEDQPAGSVLSRVHSGTVNFAAALTAPAALDFHDAIGPACKAARLRYLRDRWVSALRGTAGIDILTPDESGMAAGITSFRLKGGTSSAHNQQIVDTLRERYGIFTARRTGLERGDCVRITPAVFNSVDDVDRLTAALRELLRA